MADDLTLYTLAGNVLASIESYYSTQAVALPARRYVSDGLPAVDCDQLTVDVRRTFASQGDPRQETPTAFEWVFGITAEIAVQLWRCAPVIEQDVEGTASPPAAHDIEASALTKLSDAEMVRLAVLGAYREGNLGSCHGVQFASWSSLGPEGAYTGGETLLRVVLD